MVYATPNLEDLKWNPVFEVKANDFTVVCVSECSSLSLISSPYWLLLGKGEVPIGSGLVDRDGAALQDKTAAQCEGAWPRLGRLATGGPALGPLNTCTTELG